MKRLLSLLCLLLTLCLLGSACAETWYVYTENGGALNLRSAKDNTILTRIPYGTELEPNEEKSTEQAAYVTYGGKSGYVKWQFLVKEPPVSAEKLSAKATPEPAKSPELPSEGDGAYSVTVLGPACVQYGAEGKAYGSKYGSIAYDAPLQVVVTADKRPEYWVINGIRYDFEPNVPKFMVLVGGYENVVVEAVPKGSGSHTLLTPDQIRASRTGETLTVTGVHAKICHLTARHNGKGGWMDMFDFTNDYMNLATQKREQGGQLTCRVRASSGKSIRYWKFNSLLLDFSTDVTSFVVNTLNTSMTYEPVFSGSITKAAEEQRRQAVTVRVTVMPVRSAPEPTPTPLPLSENVPDKASPMSSLINTTVLYYNPDGGKYYHIDQNCTSVSAQFTLVPFYYSDIHSDEYNKLLACPVCKPPQ